MKRFLLLVILAALCNTVMAAVSARVDNTTATFGNAITLTITAEGRNSTQPDTSSLLNDFQIISQQQRSQYNMINGQGSSSTSWIYSLLPKKTGRFLIPAVVVGSEQTKPIAINVLAQGQKNSKAITNEPNIFVRVTAEPGIPYVDQQVLVKVKIYIDNPDRIQRINISELKVEGAEITPVGQEVHTQEKQRGKIYQVIQKNYALFANQAGPITIKDVITSGLMIVPQSNRQFDPFSSFYSGSLFNQAQAKPFQRIAPALTLDVQNIPESIQRQDWFPATDVRLEESWSKDPAKLNLGEPVTRTITIYAQGSSSNRIPSLPLNATNTIKIYPDAPKRNDSESSLGLNGTYQQSIAYVADHAGSITLPSVAIDWYDLKTHQQRTASLPAREIKVIGKQPAGTSVSAEPTQNITTPITAKTHAEATNSEAVISKTTNDHSWLLVILGLGGWLFAMVFAWLWWQKPKSSKHSDVILQKSTMDVQQEQNLKHACKSNLAKSIEQAIIQDARQRFNDKNLRSLTQINKHLEDNHLAELLRTVDQVLYGHSKQSINGQEIYSAYKKACQNYPSKTSTKRLASLYP